MVEGRFGAEIVIWPSSWRALAIFDLSNVKIVTGERIRVDGLECVSTARVTFSHPRPSMCNDVAVREVLVHCDSNHAEIRVVRHRNGSGQVGCGDGAGTIGRPLSSDQQEWNGDMLKREAQGCPGVVHCISSLAYNNPAYSSCYSSGNILGESLPLRWCDVLAQFAEQYVGLDFCYVGKFGDDACQVCCCESWLDGTSSIVHSARDRSSCADDCYSGKTGLLRWGRWSGKVRFLASSDNFNLLRPLEVDPDVVAVFQLENDMVRVRIGAWE